MVLLHSKELANYFNKITQKVYVWGCSETTRKNLDAQYLKVDYVIDNDLNKIGRRFFGFSVVSLTEVDKEKSLIILWGNHIAEILKQLRESNFQNFVIIYDQIKDFERVNFDVKNLYQTSKKKVFFYLPWVKLTGDKLINILKEQASFEILPLRIIKEYQEKDRYTIVNLAKNFPQIYKQLITSHLKEIKKVSSSFIFTFDWFEPIRIISRKCDELGIKRFLILHESVFLNSKKYYLDESTQENTPLAEHVICWGDLQKNIFIQRGVEQNRLITLGAPKFDKYINYKPSISKDEFFNHFGLNKDKTTILYALQLMDIQIDQEFALQKQRCAIDDLISYCLQNDIQLIVRGLAFSHNKLLLCNNQLKFINDSSLLYFDKRSKICAEDAMFYSDLVASVNSTMLLESLLLGKSALSTKYFEFEQIWKNIDLPCATDKDELFMLLDEFKDKRVLKISKSGWQWAEKNLSCGKFDGKSTERIQNYLEKNFIK